MDNVFVYGSLRKGFGNHRLLVDAEYRGTYTALLPFYMIDLGAFPALVKADNSPHSITVEHYVVNSEQLARLDMLEGYPTFYDRKRVPIPDSDETAWIYFFHDAGYYRSTTTVVDSGDWDEHTRKFM